MRFLLDESADYPLVETLRGLGHDATAIVTDHPRALADSAVLAIALREERVLITNDTDFGELIVRNRMRHAGVILLRLGSESLDAKAAALRTVLERHAEELRGFVVVTRNGVRIRQNAEPPHRHPP